MARLGSSIFFSILLSCSAVVVACDNTGTPGDGDGDGDGPGDTPDAGRVAPDSGSRGSADSGLVAPDSGSADSGLVAPDSGSPDGGLGEPDSGPQDGGLVQPDAGSPDGGATGTGNANVDSCQDAEDALNAAYAACQLSSAIDLSCDSFADLDGLDCSAYYDGLTLSAMCNANGTVSFEYGAPCISASTPRAAACLEAQSAVDDIASTCAGASPIDLECPEYVDSTQDCIARHEAIVASASCLGGVIVIDDVACTNISTPSIDACEAARQAVSAAYTACGQGPDADFDDDFDCVSLVDHPTDNCVAYYTNVTETARCDDDTVTYAFGPACIDETIPRAASCLAAQAALSAASEGCAGGAPDLACAHYLATTDDCSTRHDDIAASATCAGGQVVANDTAACETIAANTVQTCIAAQLALTDAYAACDFADLAFDFTCESYVGLDLDCVAYFGGVVDTAMCLADGTVDFTFGEACSS